jgi:hypothetical protein
LGVTAARLVTVTLARAWDAGEAKPEAGLIEFAVVLDPQGHPDLQAWLDDPAPWPARRLRPGAPDEPGDVAHDEEGWQLRFFAGGTKDPDAPPHRICHIGGGLRPGEVLTLRAPEGREASWRVVGVSPREG